MDIKDFIDYIITFNDVDEILEKYCESQNEKGLIFERLFDIVIKFGMLLAYKNDLFSLYFLIYLI